MGNYNSNYLSFEDRIVAAELDLLLLTEIPEHYFTRKNVIIDHYDEKVCIRTIIIDDKAEIEKPTLVMLHGFASAIALYYPLFAPLFKHYRLVCIDMLGFGASSRVTLPEELYKDSKAIDEYQVSWMETWVNQMTSAGDMPKSFFLHGHSYGGYLSALYAIRNQDRVKALFLNSPIGHEKVPDNYDEIKIRMSCSSNEPDSDFKLDMMKGQWEKRRTAHDLAKILPDSGVQYVAQKLMEDDFDGYPIEHYKRSHHYISTMYSYGTGSDNQKALHASFAYGGFAKYPLTAPDKLGNPDLPFPIAYAVGDRDWVGTDGAD